MALIKCSECGHMVSNKAEECPKCGNPITKEAIVSEEPEKNGNGKKWALIVALLCLIGGGGYYAYSKFDDVGSDKDAIVELTPEFVKSIEKYDILCIFSEGLAAVSKDNKWGYINTKGQEVISTQIDAFCVGRFSGGLAFVAKEKGKEVFSIIDRKGNIIFEGKGFYNSDDYPRCEEMPYFINDKIYVPTLNNKYQVYDTQGAKLEEVNSKIGDSVYRQHEGAKHSVFFEDLRVSEKIDLGITKCGLKDSVGNVIISAKYDDIGNKEWFDVEVDKEYQHNACVSNGVVLVVLDELNEDYYLELEGKKVRHYGYADLKGNDTFTEHLKSLCQEAEKKAIQKMIEKRQGEYDAEIMEGNGNYDWLQGTWTTKAIIMGQTKLAKLVIDGNYATFYSDGEVLDKGEYEIYDGKINFGSTYIHIDEEKQLIMYDDNHYFSHSSQPTTSVSVATPEQEKELNIMARLKELNNMSIELTNELARMRNSGRMDPVRYMYIKQTVLNNKDEQIRLARQLGDNQLVYEYQQQKQKLEQAYRVLENNY